MLQGYRPGERRGARLRPRADRRALRPGIVYVSLSAYGRTGPWAARRGFDSLVQTATGFNDAEGEAAGSTQPKALPMQVLDMASAFLLAFGAEAALLRQREKAAAGMCRCRWRERRCGCARSAASPTASARRRPTSLRGWRRATPASAACVAVRHAARFSATPAGYRRPSVRPEPIASAWD